MTTQRTVYCGIVTGVFFAAAAASAPSQTRTRTNPDFRRTRPHVRSVTPDGPQADLGRSPIPTPAEHQRRFQQRMAEMQRQAEEMERRAEESKNNAIRQALSVTEEQWRRIKPQLDLIERLKAEAGVAVDPDTLAWAPGFQGNAFSFGGGFAGGAAGGFGAMGGAGQPEQSWSQYKSWSWPPAATDATPGEMTDGEALCAQLGDLLRGPAAPVDEIAQKVAALRQIRQAARQRLARTRKNLQGMLTPQQQLPLIALGYLD